MTARVTINAAEARLEAAPIRPDWVISGAPTARSAELSRSADGSAATAVWECTGGAFHWIFDGDETVHVLEGEVTINAGAGDFTLRAGDVAFFPAGTHTRWDVNGYVKKLAFSRDGLPASLATRLWRRLRRGFVLGKLGPGQPDSRRPPSSSTAGSGAPRIPAIAMII